MKVGKMVRLDCECPCGRSFSTFVQDETEVACPYCNGLLEVSSQKKDAADNRDSKSLEEATAEIIDEGGVPFSGAR